VILALNYAKVVFAIQDIVVLTAKCQNGHRGENVPSHAIFLKMTQ
jgi:hypothetical protein